MFEIPFILSSLIYPRLISSYFPFVKVSIRISFVRLNLWFYCFEWGGGTSNQYCLFYWCCV